MWVAQMAMSVRAGKYSGGASYYYGAGQLYSASVDKCSLGEHDFGTGEHHGVVLSSSKDVGREVWDRDDECVGARLRG
jgi:hypothetical protein